MKRFLDTIKKGKKTNKRKKRKQIAPPRSFSIKKKKRRNTFKKLILGTIQELMKKTKSYYDDPDTLDPYKHCLPDIYMFFRMFGTFKDKRNRKYNPCAQMEQTNIVSVSHSWHARNVMILINKILKKKPKFVKGILTEEHLSGNHNDLQALYFNRPEELPEGPIKKKVLKKTEEIVNNLNITVFKPLRRKNYNQESAYQ